MSRTPDLTTRKTEHEAATDFVQNMEHRADVHDEDGAPLWYGWALWEAFRAGAHWGKMKIIGHFRQQIKERAKPAREA